MATHSDQPTAFGKVPPRVLVVIDNPSLRETVNRMLTQVGCVVLAVDGTDRAREVCAGQPPLHIAIVDLGATEGGSHRGLAELRQILGARRPQLAVLSADADERRPPAGADVVIKKPLAMPRLVSVLKEAIRPRS